MVRACTCRVAFEWVSHAYLSGQCGRMRRWLPPRTSRQLRVPAAATPADPTPGPRSTPSACAYPRIGIDTCLPVWLHAGMCRALERTVRPRYCHKVQKLLLNLYLDDDLPETGFYKGVRWRAHLVNSPLLESLRGYSAQPCTHSGSLCQCNWAVQPYALIRHLPLLIQIRA